MNSSLLVDTDIIIDFLRGSDQAELYVKSHSQYIIISAVTVAELYAGVREDSERESLDEFINLFPVIPITSEIAKIAGLYERDYSKSHGIGLADALIAATAVVRQVGLRTLNTVHFPMVKDVKAPYQKV